MTDFLAHVERARSRSRRHAGQRFAVLCARAPEQGPESLLEAVRRQVRQEDVVAWLEDGQLGILVGDLVHPSDPLRVGQRVQGLGASGVGIASSDTAYASSQAMLSAALEAADGAARLADPELHRQSSEHLIFEGELREAISHGGLQVFYQPIINLASGRIRGFEALVRWQHPTRGLLVPQDFLELTRRCGLLRAMDRLVLAASLQQLREWTSTFEANLQVSVNLSPDHFTEENGLAELQPLLEEYREVLDRLRCDIGEQVLLDEQAVANLHRLHDLKVGFHIDDFGVSPESFHCLGSFPFDCLKVDRTLIAEMEEEVNAELIGAVLRIAARMKMRTIAEGVVTHAQLEELRMLGCAEAQGYFFAPALEPAAATRLLREDPTW